MRKRCESNNRFDGGKQAGATLVEYGLIVGLISVVAIAAVTTLGSNISSYFNTVSEQVQSAQPDANSQPPSGNGDKQ